MLPMRFFASISQESIPEVENRFPTSSKHGADIRFHGVVRDSEGGREISGIEYTFYDDMALRELHRIGEKMEAQFPEHLALVHHKVGFVAAGEASIIIRVQTAHSAEGFEISREYLARIKKTVPIWKQAVFVK